MNRKTNEWREKIGGWMDEWTDVCIDVWMNGLLAGWLDGWVQTRGGNASFKE
jgi:hypothetical protein